MVTLNNEVELRSKASLNVMLYTKDSGVFDEKAEQAIPRFDPAELVLGNQLGTGGFSEVYEIEKIALFEDDENDEDEGRLSIARNVRRDCKASYAVKRLKNTTIAKATSINKSAKTQFVSAVTDIALEVKYLSVLDHPNIIKIRGMASSDPCAKDFSFLLDRLFETLNDRITAWREFLHKLSGGFERFFHLKRGQKEREKQQHLADRLCVAEEICSALEYLHSKRIIFRDLKPENIGFDAMGKVKLFDFGLATELPDKKSEMNSVYEMSSQVGSLRYMAPEVAKCKSYNEKVDVYSFGLILWEICRLKTVFSEYNLTNFRENVFEKNARPKIDKKASLTLRMIQTRCWSAELADRPDCREVRATLRKIILCIRTNDVANCAERQFVMESSACASTVNSSHGSLFDYCG